LSIKIGGERQNGGKYAEYGIFVDTPTVVRVIDTSGRPPMEGWKARDLSICIVLDIGRTDFYPEVYIGGDLKRDAVGKVTGLGGAFSVSDFFSAVGLEATLGDDYKLPAELLEAAAGKKFCRLSYATKEKDNGGYFYETWNEFRKEGADEDAFVKAFIKKRKKSGYPKNYAIEKWGPKPTVSPVGTPGNGAVTPAAEDINW
jgi:hypothetical protein